MTKHPSPLARIVARLLPAQPAPAPQPEQPEEEQDQEPTERFDYRFISYGD